MKRIITLSLAMLMLVALFAGCGQTPANGAPENSDEPTQTNDAQANEPSAETDAQEPVNDDTTTSTGFPVTDSYTAYTDAKNVVVTKLSDGLSNNADSLAASFTLLGVAMVDLTMLPISFFGLGEEGAAMGLSFFNASDVKYTENGNNYSISYVDAEGVAYTFSGTYDPAADALICKATSDGKETVSSEYHKTSFGYVSQYYFINDDGTTSLYQFAVNGEDGTFGISTSASAPAALTGSEAADFPKAMPEWYSITGSTITGNTSDGTELNFEYVPSETE